MTLGKAKKMAIKKVVQRVGDGSRLTGVTTFLGCLAADPAYGVTPKYTQNFDSTATGTLPPRWTSYSDGGVSSLWIVSASNPHTAPNCAISQPIADAQQTSLVYTSSLSTPGLVSFWWDVSSEATWDTLKFYVNEVEQFSPGISGIPGYAEITVNVPAGAALRWDYAKDAVTAGNLDQAYVDDFSITPITWECGDLYYNTVLDMMMYWDASRLKWLSVETAEMDFGAAGTTVEGQGLTGSAGVGFTVALGRYSEHSGTVVSVNWTRTSAGATSLLVTDSGVTTISTVDLSTNLVGSDLTLGAMSNDDFDKDIVLGVANTPIPPSASVDDVMGTVRMKWRA